MILQLTRQPLTPLPPGERSCLVEWFFVTGVLFGCCLAVSSMQSADMSNGTIHQATLKPRPQKISTATLFERLLPNDTGVHFSNKMILDHPKSYLNYAGSVCGGIAIGDVNGDGKPDLYLVNAPESNRLYIQETPFKFKDMTEASNTSGEDRWGAGTAMADIDNDGDLDIYVCNYDAPNQLFINQGAGKPFTESAAAYGLDMVDASIFPTFADYDNDGNLDVFVLTYRYVRPGGRPQKPPVGFKNGRPYILAEHEKYYHLRQTGPNSYTADTCGRPDRLFRNNGDGTFSDVSVQAGIKENGHGFSATWWDYNSDGKIDLYVGNDFTDPDHLYRNNGDGTFTDVIADVMPYTTWSSMGADCADLNNDGRLDFMSADMMATTHYKWHISNGEMGDRRWFLENVWPRQTSHNTLYLNTGTDRFMEVAFMANLAATDWTWAIKLADFDNDGRVDVFTTNGASRMSTDADMPISLSMLIGKTEWDLWKDTPPLREQNFAFKNHGDLIFKDTSKAWGLDHIGMSYGAAYGDLDGDGDLDLVTADLNEPVGIYRNNSHSGNRITLRLKGTPSNRYGLGAVVHVESEKLGTQIRQLNPMTGFLASNEPSLHFGLGNEKTISKLTVNWPSGVQQVFTNLQTNLRYTIEETTPRQAAPTTERPRKRFIEMSRQIGLDFKHQETIFEDRQRQPLLPSKHSQLGGGMAWGDVDGDGDEDVYLAGASGQPGALFIQISPGHFEKDTDNQIIFNSHQRHEDMAPLWLDGDLDGDLDLFVSSGGVECNPGDPVLYDRLYLNDGKGKFTLAPEEVLPQKPISSGPAVAADFDADGDLDLFIGGRVVPAHYPTTPESRLLRNEGGRFVDVTDTIAPGLRSVGMVTSALWTDTDSNGTLDLMLTLEWGPVKCFANHNGKLTDETENRKLSGRLGWWNVINGADVDIDGDMDYVVMNVGLNTKYQTASQTNPAILLYGPMDQTNRPFLIEVHKGDQGYLPVRGLSFAEGVMPWLREKFPTFRQFASSKLNEIYPVNQLNSARQYLANHFESGILINDGKGSFDWKAFPRLIQASPGYGTVVSDFDGNGQLDYYGVQNFYTREPETGLWRGGIGFAGVFDSNGVFQIHAFEQTGFQVDGDGKGLAITDLNADGWPDLVATQNNDRLLAFINQAVYGSQPLGIRLLGRPGNQHGIGSRITIRHTSGQTEVREIYAGNGYLSQSSPTLFVTSPDKLQQVDVRWPDGTLSQITNDRFTNPLQIIQPENK
jgi:hypothetical protein